MPKSRKDFTGMTFGRLYVSECLGKPDGRRYRYRCKCECGKVVDIQVDSLRSGNSNSCGCLRRELMTTHGDHRSLTYSSWTHMKMRCFDANSNFYHRYGGRGITVCPQWSSYETFKKDMGERPSRRHSIERIDNDGNYNPENCKWALPLEQHNNKMNTIMIEHKAVRQALAIWCRSLNTSYSLVTSRLRRGWTFHDAIMRPVKRRG